MISNKSSVEIVVIKGTFSGLGSLIVAFVLGERPRLQFYVALLFMIFSTYLMVKDTVALQHTHEHEHIHTHEHPLPEHQHAHGSL
ncbi:MAG: hypothetical protein J6B77_03105 [Clostridia bacterium]|nr:hypothetical protein [Clostridia bacterium]